MLLARVRSESLTRASSIAGTRTSPARGCGEDTPPFVLAPPEPERLRSSTRRDAVLFFRFPLSAERLLTSSLNAAGKPRSEEGVVMPSLMAISKEWMPPSSVSVTSLTPRGLSLPSASRRRTQRRYRRHPSSDFIRERHSRTDRRAIPGSSSLSAAAAGPGTMAPPEDAAPPRSRTSPSVPSRAARTAGRIDRSNASWKEEEEEAPSRSSSSSGPITSSNAYSGGGGSVHDSS
mmetsp:Transcript_34065/g.101808  ORF Transcript_34065/g.101808 Transcript_34065/m.101808 type:complete len:233 (+) Transcript_34065:2348-3046(+)